MSRRHGADSWILAAVFTTCCAAHSAPTGVTPSPVQQVQRDIESLLQRPELADSYWSVLVRSLSRNDTIFSLNAHKLMMPASTMKIVTVAAAAERLGWDYVYETQLAAAGPIESGALHGDLVVVGSGDPSITEASRVLESWADELGRRGLRRVDGRIIGDARAFDRDRLGAGWTWDDLGEGYAAGVSALQFNESSAHVSIAPGRRVGDAALIEIAPAGSALQIDNELRTAESGGRPSIDVRRLPGSGHVRLRGSIPLESGAVSRTLSVDNPTLFFVTALRRALIARGIDVSGPAVDLDEVGDTPPSDRRTTLVTYRSPPLATLAVTLLKVSQNLYAETFLKTMGAAQGTPSVEGGCAAVRSTLDSWNVPTGLVMVDGSGLSRYNFLTAETLVGVLTHVDRSERLRGPFEAALPVAGRDGTLMRRMHGTPAEGNARAKTGSLANARTLAGFVRAADGEPLVFAIMANNTDATSEAVDGVADAIVERLAMFDRTGSAAPGVRRDLQARGSVSQR